MKDIKTKENVRGKGDKVKTLNKSAILSDKMKETAVRAKDYSEDLADDGEVSPDEYAENRIKYAAQDVTDTAGRDIKRTVEHGKQDIKKIRNRKAEKAAEKGAEETVRKTGDTVRKVSFKASEETVKQSVRYSEKTVKTAAKTTEQTGRTIKTAEATAKATVKTAEASAKAAEKAAEASAKAARTAAQVAKDATIAAEKAAVAAYKAVVAACKAIAAGISELAAAIGAGGAVAVIVVVVLCIVGLIVGSCFGIFAPFPGSGSSSTAPTYTLQQTVQDLNAEYDAMLEKVKADNPHDSVDLSGGRATWPEVLSVYAVKVTTDPDNPQEIATLDEGKVKILHDIFYEMNSESHNVKTEKVTEYVETVDSGGNIQSTPTEKEKKVLHITVTHKSPDEMASKFKFDDKQKEQLKEMLEADNSLWMAALYGIYSNDGQIVQVALSQIGNIGGQPYWSWYGFDSRVEWCACFVSWCANECGYIDDGVIPKYAGCVQGVQWFKDHGRWADKTVTPEPGMIIFYDWDSPNGESGPQDGSSDHTGIVWKVENGTVYTIEGNSNDSCRVREHPVGYYEIMGYGVPQY